MGFGIGSPHNIMTIPHSTVRHLQTKTPEGEESEDFVASDCRIDNYQVRPEYYQEFCTRLKLTPTRDCFAEPDDTHCKNFFSIQDSALKHEWGPDEVLWMNPPWNLLEEAAKNCCKASASQYAWYPHGRNHGYGT